MRTVLVVEDEATIRMLAVQMLGATGLQVAEFRNADEAIKFCREPANDIAAVFTDINMPGDLDGIDLARLVVATHPSAAVVVTSGRYDLKPDSLPTCVKFLPKPWTMADLLDALSLSTKPGAV